MAPSRTISLAILALLLMPIGAGLYSVRDLYAQRQVELADKRRLSDGMFAAIAQKAEKEERLAALENGAKPAALDWQGVTPDQAALDVQSWMKRVLDEAGLNIRVMSPATAENDEITLEFRAEGSLEDVQLAIYAIERNDPALSISSVSIRPVTTSNELLELIARISGTYARP